MDIIIGAVIVFVLIISAVVIAPTVKIAMDIAPYLYTNTRCSARAGLILDRKAYESLAGATSTKEIFSFLEETSYAHIVEQTQEYPETSRLLDKDLHDAYAWLATVVPDKIVPIVEAMLMRFEVDQIKELLNRLHRGEAAGDLPFVRDEQLRIKLESANDLTSFNDAVEGTPYEEIGTHASHLSRVTSQLDRLSLTTVMRAIEACKDQKAAMPFKEYWQRVIDIANIRLAQRRVATGDEVLFVPGGTVRLEEATDQNQLLEALEQSAYNEFLGEDLEQGLRASLRRQAGLVNAKYPLKGGSIVRFLIDKELEVRNLNLLIKLKTEGFESDRITKMIA